MPEAPIADGNRAVNRDPIELVIFLCTSTSPPRASFPSLVAEILISPSVTIAGELTQIIALLILFSQTTAIVLMLGCFGFVFGVLGAVKGYGRVEAGYITRSIRPSDDRS